MKIEQLIDELVKLQKIYPNADVYFTDENCDGWFETYFQTFNTDDDSNNIEMFFSTNEGE